MFRFANSEVNETITPSYHERSSVRKAGILVTIDFFEGFFVTLNCVFKFCSDGKWLRLAYGKSCLDTSFYIWELGMAGNKNGRSKSKSRNFM